MVWRVVGGSVAAWLCSLCCGWLVLGARLSPRPRLSSLQVPGLRPPVARCRPAHPRIGGTVHCGNTHGHLAPSDTHWGKCARKTKQPIALIVHNSLIYPLVCQPLIAFHMNIHKKNLLPPKCLKTLHISGPKGTLEGTQIVKRVNF